MNNTVLNIDGLFDSRQVITLEQLDKDREYSYRVVDPEETDGFREISQVRLTDYFEGTGYLFMVGNDGQMFEGSPKQFGIGVNGQSDQYLVPLEDNGNSIRLADGMIHPNGHYLRVTGDVIGEQIIGTIHSIPKVVKTVGFLQNGYAKKLGESQLRINHILGSDISEVIRRDSRIIPAYNILIQAKDMKHLDY